jgi:hypothetical protein
MNSLTRYLILAVIITGCANEKYFHYNETKNDLGNNKFSRILITGTGTSGTNLFLETLSGDLNKKLKQKNIETVYFHLGNNQKEADRTFKQIIQKEKYDAVLQFAQIDEAHNPIIASTTSGSAPTNNGGRVIYSYTTRQIRFRQKFLVKYFDFADRSHSLIDANLDLNIDFLNPGDIDKLSKQIIKSLKLVDNDMNKNKKI